MALDEVVEEVISSAKNEAKRITEEGKKEAKKILSKAEKEAKEYEERFRKETEKMLEALEKKTMASAELEATKIIMEARKTIMEDFVKSLLETLSKLDKKKKEKLLGSLAEMVRNEMKVHTIYCNKNEENIIKQLFKNVKIKHIDCAGGFIAENKEGDLSMDLTYETLVNRIKLDLLKILDSGLKSK